MAEELTIIRKPVPAISPTMRDLFGGALPAAPAGNGSPS